MNESKELPLNAKVLWKLTAMWGLSEAALGGVLHGFKIPFRGMFIAAAATIFISLIAYNSNKPGTILRSTLLVIIIKGIVSPHTPVTAYFAVFLQGLLGELFFFNKKTFRTSAIFLGIAVQLLSSLQKIIILTLIFGENLWKSIDEFSVFILNLLFINDPVEIDFSFSLIVICIYVSIHLAAGIYAGFIAGSLPSKIKVLQNHANFNIPELDGELGNKNLHSKKRKSKWWRKKSSVLFFLLLIAIVISTYIFPGINKNLLTNILIMLLRSFVIISVWYFIISPLILKLLNKLIRRRQDEYSKEILKMIDSFPRLIVIIKYFWKMTEREKKFKRISTFLVKLFAYVLSDGNQTSSNQIV